MRRIIIGMLRTLWQVSRKGEGAVNEDAVGSFGDYAWVIDGATDVFEKGLLCEEHETGWYVGKLNREIERRCPDGLDLGELLDRSVSSIYSSMSDRADLADAPEFVLPTFAIAMVRMRGSVLEYFVLGDCSIACLVDGDVESVRDARVLSFSAANREKLKALGPQPRDGKVPVEVFQETRSFANARDGYPIGSVRGTGIALGKTGALSVSEGSRILLYTDGVLDYLESSSGALERLLGASDRRSEMGKIDRFYSDEAVYRDNPRPKRRDDQTLLLMEA